MRRFWVLFGLACLILGALTFEANAMPPLDNPNWIRFLQDHAEIAAGISVLGGVVSLYKIDRMKTSK